MKEDIKFRLDSIESVRYRVFEEMWAQTPTKTGIACLLKFRQVRNAPELGGPHGGVEDWPDGYLDLAVDSEYAAAVEIGKLYTFADLSMIAPPISAEAVVLSTVL